MLLRLRGRRGIGDGLPSMRQRCYHHATLGTYVWACVEAVVEAEGGRRKQRRGQQEHRLQVRLACDTYAVSLHHLLEDMVVMVVVVVEVEVCCTHCQSMR